MRNCKALLILRSNVAKEDHTIQRIGIVGTKVTWFFKHLRMGKWWWCWVRFLPYPSGETRILELLLWQFLVQVVDLGSASHTATNPTYIYISSGISLPFKLLPFPCPPKYTDIWQPRVPRNTSIYPTGNVTAFEFSSHESVEPEVVSHGNLSRGFPPKSMLFEAKVGGGKCLGTSAVSTLLSKVVTWTT